MTLRSVAFIGSVGVPNRYGGFESFLDSCAPLMASTRPVVVTCDAGRYDDQTPTWSGVERRFIRVGANGPSSILHDLAAFFAVYRAVDAIIVLGVSAGLFMPLMRALCALGNKRLIVNIDGIEWRREKFSAMKKAYLWLADRLCQAFAHCVVVDSRALADFLSSSGRRKAVYIAYSGDQAIRCPRSSQPDYCLTICRIEPENNCDMLIDGFVRSNRRVYKFVGNWRASEYGQSLARRYEHVAGLEMIDAIYDPIKVAQLRENASVYLHGHSVGGTNPSLVEMLYYDSAILAYDCAFNFETAGAAAEYFDSADALATHLNILAEFDKDARYTARARYTRANIVAQYEQAIDG